MTKTDTFFKSLKQKTEYVEAQAEWSALFCEPKLSHQGGQKVMLDFEWAEIYGYETKRFNEQVKNNIEKFDDDFRFQLTKEEREFLRSKNLTSKSEVGSGGRRYLPFVFIEQGIYMLMTVLKGELAVRQSKALICTFKQMKDYIVENQDLIGRMEFLHQSQERRFDSLKEQVRLRADKALYFTVR